MSCWASSLCLASTCRCLQCLESVPALQPPLCILPTLPADLKATINIVRCLLSHSFPGLEREAEQRRWQLPWVAVTLYDPLLQVGEGCRRVLVCPCAQHAGCCSSLVCHLCTACWLLHCVCCCTACWLRHVVCCSCAPSAGRQGGLPMIAPFATAHCPAPPMQPVRKRVFGQNQEGDLVSRSSGCRACKPRIVALGRTNASLGSSDRLSTFGRQC